MHLGEILEQAAQLLLPTRHRGWKLADAPSGPPPRSVARSVRGHVLPGSLADRGRHQLSEDIELQLQGMRVQRDQTFGGRGPASASR